MTGDRLLTIGEVSVCPRPVRWGESISGMVRFGVLRQLQYEGAVPAHLAVVAWNPMREVSRSDINWSTMSTRSQRGLAHSVDCATFSGGWDCRC